MVGWNPNRRDHGTSMSADLFAAIGSIRRGPLRATTATAMHQVADRAIEIGPARVASIAVQGFHERLHCHFARPTCAEVLDRQGKMTVTAVPMAVDVELEALIDELADGAD